MPSGVQRILPRMRFSADALRVSTLVAAGVASGYLWRAAFETGPLSERHPVAPGLVAPVQAAELPPAVIRQARPAKRHAVKAGGARGTLTPSQQLAAAPVIAATRPEASGPKPSPGKPSGSPPPSPTPTPTPSPSPTPSPPSTPPGGAATTTVTTTTRPAPSPPANPEPTAAAAQPTKTTPPPSTPPPTKTTPPPSTPPTPTPPRDEEQDDDQGEHQGEHQGQGQGQDQTRPGWGHGDENHTHTGPPKKP
jgi:hypothetical protein